MSELKPLSEFIGIKPAAALLGISARTLQGWVRERRIVHYRFGHRVLFDPAEVRAWAKRRRVPERSRAAVGA